MPDKLPPPTEDALFPPCDSFDFFRTREVHPFDADATSYSEVNASWLADASLLAYSEESVVHEVYRKAGFAEVTTLNGHRTQAYIASSRDVTIVSFRGTRVAKRFSSEEFKNVIADWITDLRFALAESSHGGFVHLGFKDALGEIWEPLLDSIMSLQRDDPKRPIWMTGHSLGAALATLAAARLGHVKGVYTFGSPRVGDAGFHAGYRVPTFRVVHQDDIVTRVPMYSCFVPPQVDVGLYKHVGEFVLIDSSGKIHLSPDLRTEAGNFVEAQLKAFVTATGIFRHGLLWSLSPSAFYNHSPLYYAMQMRL
ncbi:lipase (class 3) [Roseimicrobium gellanilyticum]|uniref:Lipase (Class 3) n=1 Tax=Roseimicrobium gellanilyticum TaxID=748857 RepID=A0A366HNN5_9BACT|nr:lipase family protein [Roseimicrobium gellanilyticum]RBP45105.1 lipase (class 3) [Roseimicrobium gellanilyticum]